jgi:hypothetical protein
MKNNDRLVWKTTVLALAAAASLCDRGRGIGADDPAKPPAVGKPASEKPAPRDWIELFGTNEGKPVDLGFLFYDGRYVEAPYRVSRRGVGLYVNELRLPYSGRWPPRDVDDDKDPGPPPGLTRNSTFSDLQFKDKPGSWTGRKLRWLKRQYAPDEARRLYVQYLRDLPFVAKVEVVSANQVKLTTHAGEVVDIIGVATARPYVPPTKEQVIEGLEHQRGRLERRLGEGDCIVMFKSGSELSFGQQRAARDLPVAVEILSSNRTAAEKGDLLERMGIFPEQSPMFMKLVTNFQPSAQLAERARALAETTGVKPRTMQEIPRESLRQIMERIKKEEMSKEKPAAKRQEKPGDIPPPVP